MNSHCGAGSSWLEDPIGGSSRVLIAWVRSRSFVLVEGDTGSNSVITTARRRGGVPPCDSQGSEVRYREGCRRNKLIYTTNDNDTWYRSPSLPRGELCD